MAIFFQLEVLAEGTPLDEHSIIYKCLHLVGMEDSIASKYEYVYRQ